MTHKHVQMVGVLVAPVPAVVVGAFVMRGADVPASIWLLNGAAAVVGISAAAVALAWPELVNPQRVSGRWFLLAGLALLGATLLVPGTEGVHRWLPLGHVRIHAGAVLLPPLLVALWETSWVTSAAIALTILLVLLLQPDRAQALSFGAAWIGIVAARREDKAAVVTTVSLLIAVACLFRPDPLEPVPYVEGIVGVAATQGPMLAGAGILSIAVLPVALALFLERPVGVVLAVYTIGTLLAAWLGNYPVPILGYGVSPILGYFGAVAVYALLRRSEGVSSSATPPAV